MIVLVVVLESARKPTGENEKEKDFVYLVFVEFFISAVTVRPKKALLMQPAADISHLPDSLVFML